MIENLRPGYKGPYAMFTDEELERIETLASMGSRTPTDEAIVAKIAAVWNSPLAFRKPSDEKNPGVTIGDRR